MATVIKYLSPSGTRMGGTKVGKKPGMYYLSTGKQVRVPNLEVLNF